MGAKRVRKPAVQNDQPVAVAQAAARPARGGNLATLQAAADSGAQAQTLTELQGLAVGSDVVQRIVYVGGKTTGRPEDVDPTHRTELERHGMWHHYIMLQNDRQTAFDFTDEEHLLKYLAKLAGDSVDVADPATRMIDQSSMAEAHERVQDMRFGRLNVPSSHQIPEHGMGAHNIPPEMLPPIGSGQSYGLAEEGSDPHLSLFTSQIPAHVPVQETEPLTFGDPDAPSMVMDRGGLNLGMHIQPTNSGSKYRKVVPRSAASYGGIHSVTGRVRGHPFTLHDSQPSTDPNSNFTFDTDPRAYTDESDSTSTFGGTSSFRYNKLENPALNSGQPFTQANVNPALGNMGISQPTEIATRSAQSGGGYVDRRWDNSGATDYRGQASTAIASGFKGGKQAHQDQTAIGNAVTNPFPEAPVRRFGEDYQPSDRRTTGGYASPLPTPYFADRGTTSSSFTLNHNVEPGERVQIQGTYYIVTEVTARDSTGKTTFDASEDPSGEFGFNQHGTFLNHFK